VFATAFRYLRRSNPPAPHVPLHERAAVLPSLRVTYHVGEDFLDLVDGLRAIDEAIRFLGYQRGDRLGHALALGVDAAEWYARKNKVVVLRRQDLLDNLAWMHGQLRQVGSVTFQPLLSQLEKAWTIHYRKLSEAAHVENDLQSCTIHDYYEAWRLRGDDPAWYDYPEEERGVFRSAYGSEWAQCMVRQDYREEDLESVRLTGLYQRLYQTYHRKEWREAGNQTVDYEISLPYMQAVGVLQERLQHDILQRGICIESNPTSNYLISTFRRYDAHPITRLFNLGLTYDPADLAACPQLNVSINTDDLGIFDTSLENEYALMATALQKAKTADGQPRYKHALIMDWLDRVRLNGLSQSFLLREGGRADAKYFD
jgi:Adenosine deaminase